MANRHLSRSIVLQSLFEWDFGSHQDEDISDILNRNTDEFGPGLNDMTFMSNLSDLVVKKKKIIDDIIEKAAPDWPIDKISVVDRNVLRIGLVELLFGDRQEVPPKVAINEAIELAKTFGGENSGKFVNGVLGAVYKEIGEPGKDDMGKKKPQPEKVPYEKLPIEKKGGAIIYSIDEKDVVRFAMVFDVFGRWTLSKGGIEENETPEDGTVREVKEEIGLDVEIVKKLGENEYIAHHPEKGEIRKQVSYFLAKAQFVPLVLHSVSGGLKDARWFEINEIEGLTIYDDVLGFMIQAIQFITEEHK
ncbi:MAG: transcription antitermination factor NusB [Candidatus Pacebacteria bacterium]|nr:transcription antitermination factor NusB [Candidatus Paceibacterota bacterium]MBP9780902.1 transcription antitermination factor NusB [Candidatus Paceibacterota bacterium]